MTTVAAVEIMEEAAKTFETLHSIDVDRRRVEEISDAELRSFRDQVRVVAGGPPCQPWSIGGLRRGSEDERDGFTGMVRALTLIQPEAFLIENVAGLEAGKARPYFLALLDTLRGLGYRVYAKVLNAADYGAPQLRRRLFMIGMREGEFSFPEPTHGPEAGQPWVPAGSVLSDEPVGEPNTAIVTYAKNPDLRPSPYDGHLFNGGGRPMDLNAPARTILASAGGNKTPFIDTEGIVLEYHASLWAHFKAHGRTGLEAKVKIGRVSGARRITVDESAALQTFPDGTAFHGKKSTQYTLVGNAVPPVLAAAVGGALREALGVKPRP
jgi:DNA (cytosine-5)-methyltransferase 1